MASIKDRKPGAPASTVILALVGAALTAIAALWSSWYITPGNRFGLRGPAQYDDKLPGDLPFIGNVTFFAALIAIACVLALVVVGLSDRLRPAISTLAGFAGLIAVGAAAYFVSEIPADARMGWCFPIFLQGATVLLIASLRPRD